MRKVKGSALLTALFIMTLVAIVATAMSTRLQLDIYRTRLILMHDKLYLASEAVSFWALEELNNKDRKDIPVNKQAMVAVFPKKMEQLYNQVQVTGGLYDLQARFNLNNLTDKKDLSLLASLLGRTNSKLNAIDSYNMVLATKDWLNNYDLSRGKDKYTAYYLGQNPPYNPSHQIMSSSSEFRLIKDVSSSIYLALDPYVTVLPEITPININTASKPVLRSLGNGLTESMVNELIMARGEHGIKDFKDINELLKKMDLPKDQITIASHYFLAVAEASSDNFNLKVYSLIKRSKNKEGKITSSIIRESINGF